jgi:hypothetical protein
MGYTEILKTNLGTEDRAPSNIVAMDIQEKIDVEAVVVYVGQSAW